MCKLFTNIRKLQLPKPPILLSLAIIFLIGFSLFLISKVNFFKTEIINLSFELLGAFIGIAVFLEFLREILYGKIHIDEFSNIVKKEINKLIKIREFGLIHIDVSLSFKKLFDALKSGDILWWLDTFCPGEIIWVSSVEDAIKRGAIVNMLIMDPNNNSLCEMRAKELGEPYSLTGDDGELDFTKQLERFLTTFCNLQKRYNTGSLNIVLYNDLLGVPCYVVERNKEPIYAYSSMYLTKPTGLGFPHFLWNRGINVNMCDILFTYVIRKVPPTYFHLIEKLHYRKYLSTEQIAQLVDKKE